MRHAHVLAVREPRRIGHERLDQEDAAGAEVLGDAREALHLLLLGGEHEEGVEHDEDQLERAVDSKVGEVADGHRNGVAARLGAQLRHHRLGGFDPVHVDALRGQGQGDPAGADAQLQSAAVARQPRQYLHGAGAGHHPVVDLRDAVAVGRRRVVLHVTSPVGKSGEYRRLADVPRKRVVVTLCVWPYPVTAAGARRRRRRGRPAGE